VEALETSTFIIYPHTPKNDNIVSHNFLATYIQLHQGWRTKTPTSKEASEQLRKFSGAKETRTPDPLHAIEDK